MNNLFFFLLFITISPQLQAGAGGIAFKKSGDGEGKLCEVSSIKKKTCKTDQTGKEMSYALDSQIIILAQPLPGSEFLTWKGDCFGLDPLCEIEIKKGGNEAIAIFTKASAPTDLAKRSALKIYFESECLQYQKNKELKKGMTVETCVETMLNLEK